MNTEEAGTEQPTKWEAHKKELPYLCVTVGGAFTVGSAGMLMYTDHEQDSFVAEGKTEAQVQHAEHRYDTAENLAVGGLGLGTALALAGLTAYAARRGQRQ